MSADTASYLHMTTSGNTGTLGGTGSGGTLVSVNVNTGAASAVLTLKVKDTNGATIAVLDASAKGSYQYGCQVSNGVFASLAGGNADVTVCFG